MYKYKALPITTVCGKPMIDPFGTPVHLVARSQAEAQRKVGTKYYVERVYK